MQETKKQTTLREYLIGNLEELFFLYYPYNAVCKRCKKREECIMLLETSEPIPRNWCKDNVRIFLDLAFDELPSGILELIKRDLEW